MKWVYFLTKNFARNKREGEEGFDKAKHREDERKRVAKIREKQKEERKLNKEMDNMYREKEILRKREQRKRKKLSEMKSKSSSITERNRKIATRKRKNNIYRLKGDREGLLLKVKMFTNENRRLKRKLNSPMIEESSENEKEVDVSKEILQNVSPAGKKRALKRLKICAKSSTTRKQLRLDKITLDK